MNINDYLKQNIAIQKGIGEKYQTLLQKYFARSKAHDEPATYGDLLFHLPYDYIDRREITPLAQAKAGYNNLRVRILQHLPAPAKRHPHQPRSKAPHRVQCEDTTGSVLLVFFKAEPKYLTVQLPEGEEVLIGGHLQRYDGMWQMNHPDIIGKASSASDLCAFEAIYPATEGISSKMFGKWIKKALAELPETEEWHLQSTLNHHNWLDFTASMRVIHIPNDLSELVKAKQRLAYDEALAQQLSLRSLRAHQQKLNAPPLQMLKSNAVQQAIAQLPFQLTEGQMQVLQDIEGDIASNTRMLRLLQGDVGAGKTIIAALAMLGAVKCGYQAAIMAPTEILARQHLQAITDLLGLQGIAAIDGFEIIFLAGSLNARQREAAYAQIKSNPKAVIIGTHALFQEGVEFANLGLAIIDEQHRFGVAQRLALSEKGGGENKAFAPHLLLMTATPIPRSLAMAHFGDMDISLLKQKPAGRQEIDTRAVGLKRLDEVLAGLQRAINAGEKIYWICPLVEDADDASLQSAPQLAALKAAQSRFAALQIWFGGRVGLIHGRMAMNEREAVMQAFLKGEIRILVATTVVEVGVNIPDATIMIIENAERFGLATLHQLRGRVGRSDKPSRCVLLYDENCSKIAQERLKTMRQTNDGFVIAEADWQLRGAGDLLGTKQTGAPEFKFLNLETQGDLLKAARQEAELHWSKNHGNLPPALQSLMQIFGYDTTTRFLQSG
jgi:ATP-dependent DNA helicase RecG